MKPSLKTWSSACLVLALSCFHAYVHAAANGDGLCSADETGRFECLNLGGNVIEFLGSFASSQCHLANAQTTNCTTYFYRYTGAANTQLNVAIPARITQRLKTASDLGCAQFITGGAGDPTTGFGKNQLSLGICRIALNLAGPVDVTPPAGANFVITADPSAFDNKNPLDWQLKPASTTTKSKDDDHSTTSVLFAGSLVGPFGPQAEVLETAVTLSTPNGQTVSYSNIAGNIKLTAGNARVIPPGGTKLCTVNVNGDPKVPYTAANFSANWTCETVTFATDQCDIKTDGGDPCRMIGGTCIKY